MESATPKRGEVFAIELPAPEGWKKKFTPKKAGTPRKNVIVFISPTGEEIKNKRQLDQYLKAHPENPSASEFDWGTGNTPRRSARLSEKSKAVETPESESPTKKQRISSSKKEAEGKKEDSDGEGEATEAPAEETKVSAKIAMENAEDVGDDGGGKLITEEAIADKDNVKNITKQETHGEEVVTEEVSTNKDDVMKTMENIEDKINMEKPENYDTSDAKEEGAENKPPPAPGLKENNKETRKEPVLTESAFSEQNDPKVEKQGEDATIVGQEEHYNEEIPKKVANAEETKAENDGHQGGKSMENNMSVSVPREPKASQVSC